MDRSRLSRLAVICLLPACNATVQAGRDVAKDGGDGDAAIVPDAITRDARTDAPFACPTAEGGAGQFNAEPFLPSGGCLMGGEVKVPVCGCYGAAGLGFSSWCIVAPDGTTYFTISDDACDIALAPGWYAQQSRGSSQGLTPTDLQLGACALLSAASKTRDAGVEPTPPACAPSDAAVTIDAAEDSGSNLCPPDAATNQILGGPCSTYADCGPESMFTFCEFDPAQGCSAKGRCITFCGATSGGATGVSGCACDGPEEVFLPFVLGNYAPEPLRGTPVGGTCPPDGGAQPDGGG
jgi:hypothetical protein